MRTINYKVSYEKLISRLPAMFAFIEWDAQNEPSIVKATKGEQGNYGKIVADLTVPYSFPLYDEYYECEDGTRLKVNKGSNSYRTIIDVYYKAIKDTKWERDKEGNYVEPFLAFVERGIGLKYVGLSEKVSDKEKCGVYNKEIYPLAPDYIYLGDAKRLYNEVLKKRKQLDLWDSQTKLCKEDLSLRDALWKECFLMRIITEKGEKGDLLKKLEELIQEAELIATEYYNYATDSPKLNFNINLTNTIKDLGMVTPYIEEWIAGKRYYNEDVVYYVDEYGYGMTWECRLYNEDGTIKNGLQTDEFGRPYIEGQYDGETELVLFENGKQELYDSNNPKQWWFPQSLNWVEENHYFVCKKCNHIYITSNQPLKCKECGNDEFIEKNIIPNEEFKENIIVNGTCNSHLQSLRRYNEYVNMKEEIELPKPYTDWLWYYRIGTIVNREMSNDEFGNIAVMYPSQQDGQNSVYPQGIQAIENNSNPSNIVWDKDNKTALNLAIWGDVITDIKCENISEDEGIITFEYWLGVHLAAEVEDNKESSFWYSIDEDGNYKYYFTKFKIDIDSDYGRNSGVKYSESYIYYNGNTDMEVLIDFIDGDKLKINDTIYGHMVVSRYKNDEYLENYHGDYEEVDKEMRPILYKVIKPFINGPYFMKGDRLSYNEYKNLYVLTYMKGEDITTEMFNQLTEKNQRLCNDSKVDNDFIDDNKKKCKPIEDTIWTLVDRGVYENDGKGKTYIEKYLNGEFDKDYIPEDVNAEDTNAPYYYKTYEKMEFNTADNSYVYDIKIGNNFKKVSYIRTNFEAKVDITHIDVEKAPLIRYDYYNGVNFQPSVNKDVYVERGVTQAFEKHIKFSEIKTFEDLENYANGGFFVISSENIDLG